MDHHLDEENTNLEENTNAPNKAKLPENLPAQPNMKKASTMQGIDAIGISKNPHDPHDQG